MSQPEETLPPATRDRYPGEHENGDLDFPFTFPLRTPIPVMGEEMRALVLHEPTGDLVIRHNLLYGLGNDGVLPVLAAMTKEPGGEIGVPEGSLKRMHAFDFIRIVSILTRFFGVAAR